MLVSPAEPKSIKVLGKVSSLPEKRGADILIPANGDLAAIQRKEVNDLIASLQDGRLAKELLQLQSSTVRVLIVEGRLRWSSDGLLMGRDYGAPWTRAQHRNLLRSVQSAGVWIETTDDAADTVTCVKELAGWLASKHSSTVRRPGPTSPWGKADNRDWAMWLMQGFEGVGPDLAKRIVDEFGRPPLQWTCTAEDLKKLPGIGPKKAKGLMEALA